MKYLLLLCFQLKLYFLLIFTQLYKIFGPIVNCYNKFVLNLCSKGKILHNNYQCQILRI